MSLFWIGGPPLLPLIPFRGETASAPGQGALVLLTSSPGRHSFSSVRRRFCSKAGSGAGGAPPLPSDAPPEPISQFCSGKRCYRIISSGNCDPHFDFSGRKSLSSEGPTVAKEEPREAEQSRKKTRSVKKGNMEKEDAEEDDAGPDQEEPGPCMRTEK
ncbi:hypothetical protein NDU88_010208 [Pleurodeles waltl]|uniref:Uncharacterized protein n=1 Tax=Pleurodeles waltl TaxID=8319 RepID=A0AAV7RYK1_PLEWA|nr:hypothetical protein NDU88_010208 [Pleurodeles waltl]